MNIIKRLKAACRTNEPQASTVIVLMALSGIALAKRTHDTPLWFIMVVILFWPVTAFIVNLINPMPKPVDNE